MEFAHAVVDDGIADGRMLGGFVLDDLQRPNAGALLAPGAQEQAAVAGRPEQGGACRGQVGLRVKIFGDPDRVLEDDGVDIVAGVDIDAAHKLDELARLGHVVAAGLIQSFADKVECHSNFPVLQVRLS